MDDEKDHGGADAVVREALEDCRTHHRAWRKAIEMAIAASPPSEPDFDDALYWTHELEAFDRTFETLSKPAPVAANASAEARLREALFIFREFVNVNVTQWITGAGDRHHPMWSLISSALGSDCERDITEAVWRFIQASNRECAPSDRTADCDKQDK